MREVFANNIDTWLNRFYVGIPAIYLPPKFSCIYWELKKGQPLDQLAMKLGMTGRENIIDLLWEMANAGFLKIRSTRTRPNAAPIS